MKQVMRFVHILGLVLFLGSILTFLVASSVGADGGVADLAVARRVISTGTSHLSLPGLALLIAAGVALVVTGSGMLKKWWVRVMAIAAAGIVANGFLVVLPAVHSATQLAEASVAAGHLVAGYHQAYVRSRVPAMSISRSGSSRCWRESGGPEQAEPPLNKRMCLPLIALAARVATLVADPRGQTDTRRSQLPSVVERSERCVSVRDVEIKGARGRITLALVSAGEMCQEGRCPGGHLQGGTDG